MQDDAHHDLALEVKQEWIAQPLHFALIPVSDQVLYAFFQRNQSCERANEPCRTNELLFSLLAAHFN